MTSRRETRLAAVSIHFIDITGTSREDWTADAAVTTWIIDDPGEARKLKEQLTGLLGEPGTDLLLDHPAVKALTERPDVGVKLDREGSA